MIRKFVKPLGLSLAAILSLVVLVQLSHRWLHRGSAHQMPGEQQASIAYQCPMHPQIVQEHPGTCPICAMDLQLTTKTIGPKADAQRSTPLYYRHPMNPSITSPVPAKDAMGMPFIPVYEEAEPSTVEGRAPITVNLYQQQLLGVTMALVERKSLTRSIFTTGRIAYDPDLYQAQAEYVSALRAHDAALLSPIQGAAQRAESMLEASRVRLHLMGLHDDQLTVLETTRQPDSSLLLTPTDGAVWMYADVFQQELPLLQVGQAVEATLPGQPGRRFTGTIVAVDPILDMQTRSAKIRVKLSSPEMLLRPGMYVNASILADLGERLVVPRSAVLDTGKRQMVYVARGEGRFEPREVQLGLRGTDAIEVLDGLAEGERVVASGNFLIDAESQLRGAAGGMTFYDGQEAAEGASGAAVDSNETKE